MRTAKATVARLVAVGAVGTYVALVVVVLRERQQRQVITQFGFAVGTTTATQYSGRVTALAVATVVLTVVAVVLWQIDGRVVEGRGVVGFVVVVASIVATLTTMVGPGSDGATAALLLLNLLLTVLVVIAAVEVLGDQLEQAGERDSGIVAWWYRSETYPWWWLTFWGLIIGGPAAVLGVVTDVYIWLVPSNVASVLLIVRWLAARGRIRRARRARYEPTPENTDLRQLWLRDPLELMRYQAAAAGEGVFLGTGGDHWEFTPHEHSVLVLGPPRSGKTSSIVIPSLICHSGPAVSTSTKTDVLRATAAARADLRPPANPPMVLGTDGEYHGCYLFDPTGTVTSPSEAVRTLRWSPLQGCEQWEVARRRAQAMVGAAAGEGRGRMNESHWTERAGALLAPLLHVAALGNLDVAALVGWVNAHNLADALETLEQGLEGADPMAKSVLDGMENTDPRELSSIWSTASGVVACYQTKASLATTSNPNFDAERFLNQNETIYIASGAEQQQMVAPIVVGLLDDVRRSVYAAHEQAAQKHTGQERGERPARVLFALDECANIAPIKTLPAMASEAGGQGLTLLACFQDLSQVQARWPAEASGFLTLFNTNVIFRGIKERSTLELVSQLFGEHEVEKRSVSSPDQNLMNSVGVALGKRSPSEGSTTISFARERRVPFDQVARGVPGQIIVLNGAEAPDWINLTPAYAASPWTEILSGSRPTQPLPDAWHFHGT